MKSRRKKRQRKRVRKEVEVEVVSLTMRSQMINQAAPPRQKHKKEKPIRKTSPLPKRTLPKRRKNRAFILIS